MNPLNRRQFLGAVAVGAAALSPLRVRAAAVSPSARKIKLGLIGCGWYGLVDVKAAFKAGGVEVVALCDVDGDNLTKGAAEIETLQGMRPKTFRLRPPDPWLESG